MFKTSHNQRSTRKRIVIALALIALMVCAADVQLYCEQQILAHKVTCTNKFNHHEDYFNMSLNELMNVSIVS
jgi:hypothetical protein